MAISYKDTRRSEGRSGRAKPVLIIIAAIGALLWFAPQSTEMLLRFVVSVLALPRY
jgi:hypothetical protein